MARTVSSNNNIIAKTVVRGACWIRNERQKTQKPIILNAYQERISLRGLSRVFDVHRQSISRWIVEHVKSLPKLKDTLLPAQPLVLHFASISGSLCSQDAFVFKA
jgi:hypothetical protein